MSGSIISVAGGKLLENSSAAFIDFVVTLSAPSTNAVSVDFQTIGGTAQEGIDYDGRSGTLTIAAGDTSGIVQVEVRGDTVDETDENFTLQLTNPHNASLAGNAPALRATGIILDDDGTGSNLALFVSNPILYEGNSGSQSAQFTLTLSRPSDTAITLPYHTADGSATAGSDYTATSGSVTFAPGQTTTTVDVPVLGDTTVEATENFSLVVTPTPAIASGVADATGVATILDDDAGGAAQPTISVAGGELVENSGAAFIDFVVTLSAPSTNAVSVDFQTIGGTAQEGIDYDGRSGTLTIAAGDTSGIVQVEVRGDTVDETDENFTLQLTNPHNASLAGNAPALRATGIILDDDGTGSNLALFVSNPILYEGNSGSQSAQFTLTLSRPSDTAITLPYHTADGSATAGSDYTATSGSVTFAPGQTTATVDVPVLGDTTVEATENFSLVVTPTPAIASGVADATGVATILDDDAGGAAQPTISVAGGELVENSGAAFIDFVVTLSAPSTNAVSVDFQTIGGTAQEGIDYDGRSGTLTIAAGDTSGIVQVEVRGDTVDETDENFTLQLTNPHNASLAGNAPALRATGIILDDDGTGSNLALFVSNPILYEGNSGSQSAQFTLTLSRPSDTAITLPYHTADGSATAGSDYTATSGSVTFAPGQTTATVDVPVLGDTTVEATENFSLVVTPTPAIASGVADAVGVATILDDDAGGAAQPTISVAGGELVENSGAAFIDFVVTLSAPSTNAVSVDFQTIGGTAQEGIDYDGRSGTLTIAAGDTSGIVQVEVRGDTVDETDENFTLQLTNPHNASLAGNAPALRATGIILDDDGTGSNLALFVSNPILYEGNSGSQSAQFTLTLSRPSDTAITLPYHTADGSATAGSDYTATSGSVTFAPGQTTATVDVPVLGDTTVEATENFSLVVTPTPAIASGVADAVGVATILDDDAGGAAQPTISVAGGELVENSGAAFIDFVVTLSAPSTNAVSVDFQTIGGTAQEGIDYDGRSGTLTIAAGDTSGIVQVEVRGDTVDETDENFTLQLTNPHNASLAGNAPALRATGIILDDDGTGSNLALFVSNPILYEGNSGSQSAQFTLTLSRPSDTAITLPYHTADGSATAGSDYTATSGSVTFAPGQTTTTVDVPVLGDTTVEATENFSLVVTPTPAIASGVADATGVATILDDDAGGAILPTISVAGGELVENSSAAFIDFVVTLSAPSTNAVSVDFQTIGGTAQEGIDYDGRSGTLTIAAGDTSGIVQVEVRGDTVDETDENFTLQLTNPHNASLAGNAPALRATGIILDDDGTGSNLALFVSNPILYEGNSGSKSAQFTLTLSRPSDTAITTSYHTADGSATAGSDYTATSGSVTFAPGQTTTTVDVPVLGDTTVEPDENFTLTVTPGSGIASATGTATIVNDDLPCFLPGTLVRTDQGEVPVELLREGDTVLTLSGETRKLVWVGVGRALVVRGRRTAATPVIVRKGALGENVPHRDLRITKGHSLYLQDVLIPVEYLINHRSIIWDDHAQEVEVYHLELETHDVLLANGAAAETYRDDGNRWLFRNANEGWHLPPKEPCVPVMTGGPIVDAVWRRLLDRAGSRPGLPLSQDADLHILVDGTRVDATAIHGTAHVFTLDIKPSSVKVMSRAAAPAELGIARDPRILGVALRCIAIRQDTRFRIIEASDEMLTCGFHAFEPNNGLRWTDGEAELPTALFHGFTGTAELVMHVGGMSWYPVPGKPVALLAAA